VIKGFLGEGISMDDDEYDFDEIPFSADEEQEQRPY
jgi:hypothetical protein